MTKITFIGTKPRRKITADDIEFVGCVYYNGKGISAPQLDPSSWSEIKLKKVIGHEFDYICFCSDKIYVSIYTANLKTK